MPGEPPRARSILKQEARSLSSTSPSEYSSATGRGTGTPLMSMVYSFAEQVNLLIKYHQWKYNFQKQPYLVLQCIQQLKVRYVQGPETRKERAKKMLSETDSCSQRANRQPERLEIHCIHSWCYPFTIYLTKVQILHNVLNRQIVKRFRYKQFVSFC